MGGLFCSYFVENSLTSLRNAIVTSDINEIKRLVDSSKEAISFRTPFKYLKQMCSYNQSSEDDLINCQIDNKGKMTINKAT